MNSTRTFADDRIVSLDADGISAAVLGRPIPNTAFLGALSVLCDRIGLDDVKQAIRQYMPKKLHEKKHRHRRGRSRGVGGGRVVVSDAPGLGCRRFRSGRFRFRLRCCSRCARRRSIGRGFPEGRRPHSRAARRRARSRRIRAHHLFRGGYLVAKNAGWRNMRPVIDAGACTGCLQCYLYCPDGAVYKAPSDSQPAARVDVAASAAVRADVDNRATVPVQSAVAVDYDFCKGCGVCVTVCRFGAIAMVAERGESEGGTR